jgi:DNA primase
MTRLFTRAELFEIRNAVGIGRLIADELMLPVKGAEGAPKFLCPLCNEFQTGVNPSTNLARCFRCGKNFNVIDLFMIVRGTGFVETVERLRELLPGAGRTRRPEDGCARTPAGPAGEDAR